MTEAQTALRKKLFDDLEAKHERERQELDKMLGAALNGVQVAKVDGRKNPRRRKAKEPAAAVDILEPNTASH